MRSVTTKFGEQLHLEKLTQVKLMQQLGFGSYLDTFTGPSTLIVQYLYHVLLLLKGVTVNTFVCLQ